MKRRGATSRQSHTAVVAWLKVCGCAWHYSMPGQTDRTWMCIASCRPRYEARVGRMNAPAAFLSGES